MRELNPYESPKSLPFDACNKQLPVSFLFSAMVALIASLLTGFLLYTGVFFGFRWPGSIKSAIAFTFLLVCLLYEVIRGKKDLVEIRSLSGNERQIGIVHVLIIIAFCFAIRGFAHWVTLNTPF